MKNGTISGTQWRCLAAAWLGWCFDGLDGYLYVVVAGPLVKKLLASELGAAAVTPDLVTSRAALIQCFFLIGWAVGGAVFGRIGDRLGRAKTLTLTILTYAIFTGFAFFVTSWWQLLIVRFIAALGIGGEWAAGSALVGETLPKRHRVWASALLQSGYMVGCIMAVFTYQVISTVHVGETVGLDPRYVFLVGVLPAFLTVWIRRSVPESESWQAARDSGPTPPLSSLFTGSVARITWLTTTLTSIAMTTVWGFLYFGTALLREIPGVPDAKRSAFVTNVTVIYLLVNIAANFVATYLARWVGYRWAYFLMMLGALTVSTIGFGQQHFAWAPAMTPESAAVIFSLMAFFGLGLFGMFPLYVPELFPTLLRTLGAGFSYNVGRLVSAVGVLGGGWLVNHAGGTASAIWWTGLLYVPGLAVALMMPELTRRQEATSLASGAPPADGDAAHTGGQQPGR